jgi:hypothetical protein
MLEQAGRLGPSVPIITARVASGSRRATAGALSAGGAAWLQRGEREDQNGGGEDETMFHALRN